MAGLLIEPTCDADLLTAVHLETVNYAYSGFFPPGSVPPTAEQHRATWVERLSDPTGTAFVARRDGKTLGTVLIRADPDFVGEGQIVGLHVLPAAWRRGVGAALHDHALLVLRRSGYRRAGLWVIAQNQRARRLYESRGWQLVPAVELRLDGPTEVRYRRSLEAPTAESGASVGAGQFERPQSGRHGERHGDGSEATGHADRR